MGTPLIVVNWAWPLSSRLIPVGAPIGFSGDFSSVLARVVSAQRFSESDGWRPSKTSAIGFSAMPLGSFFLFRCCAIEDSCYIIEDAGMREQEPARICRTYTRNF